MIKIDTPEWLAEIQADEGGNLCRLFHKVSGIEILRIPPSLEHLQAQPEIYGIPVLLPPNRIDGGKFLFPRRSTCLNRMNESGVRHSRLSIRRTG